MKIFYAGGEYDHYDPKRGPSFEHENFYVPLERFCKKNSGSEIVYFPFERILENGGGAQGRRKFNENLIEAARREKPDLLFVFPYSDELEPTTLEALKKETTTVAWFADDSWRFYNYSKFWARHFSWAVTTYSHMPALYARAGQPNTIRSQWAADTEAYRPADTRDAKATSAGPDVAFVGSWSRPRARIVTNLEAQGIRVSAYGSGWPGGRISAEERNRIFSTAKINLALNPAPGLWNINSLGRLVARPSANRIVPDFHLASNLQSWLHRGIPQVKARHFEIPACGGFMMTARADDLEKFYTPGEEIVFYENERDLAAKIRYYLSPEHEAERVAIARAGYERTLREHTYEKRFMDIFQKIRLKLD
jgi:spore maturation protein CgeB